MSEAFLCCDECFEFIGKRCTAAAKFWIDLCAISVKEGGLFFLKTDKETLLRMLEVNGYVITTENSKYYIVKVKGKKSDTDGVYFCPRCRHE